jgi:hypothetical protein
MRFGNLRLINIQFLTNKKNLVGGTFLEGSDDTLYQ